VVSGAGSGLGSEVSNGDVVVGAVDSEDCGSEDSGAEVGVDGSAAWVGSDVGSLVAELVAELEGSAVCFCVEAAVVVSVVVFSEVVFSEVDVLEVGRSEGSAGEDGSEDGSADVVLLVDSVVWEGSAVCFSVEAAVVVSAVVFLEVVFSEVDVLEVGRSEGSAGEDASEDGSADVVLLVDFVVWEGSAVCFCVEAAVVVSVVVFSEVVFSEVDVLEVGRSEGSAGEDGSEDGSADGVLFVDFVVWEGSADWEDEEVAVGALAATWGAGSELEDGVEAGVVRDGAGAGAGSGAGAEATLLAASLAAAAAAEAAREIAWESSTCWPPRGSL